MGFISHLTDTYHRNLIEDLLQKFRHFIKGHILDIGSKNRRYDGLFNGDITAIDIVPNQEYNVIKGDLAKLEFESNKFDSVVCLEVLHYLDPLKCIDGFNEIFRVLKKGGKALISICFVYHEDDDNYRLTYNYIRSILQKIDNLNFRILKVGNRYTSIYDIIREKIKKRKSKIKNLGPIIGCFFLYLSIKILGLEKKEDKWPEGYFIIYSKK